jgi:REP element-mobilizing transposase RayT
MNSENTVYAAQYFTATIYKWQTALADDSHKDIIIDSLQYLVNDKRIELNAFVIMSNHIHLIWQALPGFTPSGVQASFMKYTAQQIKRSMLQATSDKLSDFKVNKYDREYQIWKREPLGIELLNESMFVQKLEYIHYNPVRAGLCSLPEEYYYSSAKFYYDGTNSFGILKHYSGN